MLIYNLGANNCQGQKNNDVFKDIFNNLVQYKCWHYKFDIDTMVVDCKAIFICLSFHKRGGRHYCLTFKLASDPRQYSR